MARPTLVLAIAVLALASAQIGRVAAVETEAEAETEVETETETETTTSIPWATNPGQMHWLRSYFRAGSTVEPLYVIREGAFASSVVNGHDENPPVAYPAEAFTNAEMAAWIALQAFPGLAQLGTVRTWLVTHHAHLVGMQAGAAGNIVGNPKNHNGGLTTPNIVNCPDELVDALAREQGGNTAAEAQTYLNANLAACPAGFNNAVTWAQIQRYAAIIGALYATQATVPLRLELLTSITDSYRAMPNAIQVAGYDFAWSNNWLYGTERLRGHRVVYATGEVLAQKGMALPHKISEQYIRAGTNVPGPYTHWGLATDVALQLRPGFAQSGQQLGGGIDPINVLPVGKFTYEGSMNAPLQSAYVMARGCVAALGGANLAAIRIRHRVLYNHNDDRRPHNFEIALDIIRACNPMVSTDDKELGNQPVTPNVETGAFFNL